MKEFFTIVLEEGQTKEVEGERLKINGYDCFITETPGESLCGKWITYSLYEYKTGLHIFSDTVKDFAIKRASEKLAEYSSQLQFEKFNRGELIYHGHKKFPINAA